MSWELERHQWDTLRAQGSASDIPAAIHALQHAATDDEATLEYWRIDNTVVVQGAVYEAALPTLQGLLSVLIRSTEASRPQILELMVQICGGEPATAERAAGHSDIVDRCLRELVHGFSIFSTILEQTNRDDERSSCIDLLGLCCGVEPTLTERVLWYYEKTRSSPAAVGVHRLLDNWIAGLEQDALERNTIATTV